MMVRKAYNFLLTICRHVFYILFFYGNEVYFSIFSKFI